jgi:Domain of unknown function (DUF4304)
VALIYVTYMATAEQILKTMERVLAPEGFCRDGITFHRPGAGFIDVINLQGGLRHLAGRSAVNLGIYISEVRSLLGKAGSPENAPALLNPKEYECAIRVRLSKLVYGRDHWFDRSAPDVEEEISDLLERYALPYFAQYRSLPEIAAGIRSGAIPGWVAWGVKAAIFLLVGEAAEARSVLLREYDQRPDVVTAFANRIGITL